MKIAIVVILAIGALIIGAWFFIPDNSNKNETSTNNSTSTQSLPQVAVSESKNGTAYLYDVRTPEEYNTKHVENAVNFDVELIKAGSYPQVSKDSKIYVYCRSGNRSNQAKQLLEQNGYTNVTDLGGLDKMQAAGVY